MYPNAFPNACPASKSSAPAATNAETNGALTVRVDSVLGVVPRGDTSTHQYTVTAYYQRESEDVSNERRTQPEVANQSATDSSKLDCTFNKHIHIPYNSRQQFVKVAVFELAPHGDAYVGEATVPIADPEVETVSPWPLVCDFVETGVVMLSLQLPRNDETPTNLRSVSTGETPTSALASCNPQDEDIKPPGPPPLGTICEGCSPMQTQFAAFSRESCDETHHTRGPASARDVPLLKVGDIVDIFSSSAARWLQSRVVQADMNTVTVEYGERRRDIDLRDPKIHEYFRYPDPQSNRHPPINPQGQVHGATLPGSMTSEPQGFAPQVVPYSVAGATPLPMAGGAAHMAPHLGFGPRCPVGPTVNPGIAPGYQLPCPAPVQCGAFYARAPPPVQHFKAATGAPMARPAYAPVLGGAAWSYQLPPGARPIR